jgi:succinoglycan biosynthesis protein ExoM
MHFFAVESMSNQSHHISVCILTFKRPAFLQRLLEDVVKQEAAGRFTLSIVVADNDAQRSAEELVSKFAATSPVPVTYCVEPQQNISLARNRAIENATGDLIAFIDDDEFPAPRWLLTLFETCEQRGVAGVLGPVNCHFDEKPPNWVVKGKFYERHTYPTGFVIHWTQGRTGNVLFKREILEPGEMVFNPEFHRAGDQDFFRRMIAKGHVFIWCHEAVAYEVVPPIRWTRKFMLKRAFLRGTIRIQHPSGRLTKLAKAVVAVPAYTLALPFALVLGQDKFMNVLIRLCDHLGTLMTFVGIKPVKNQLVTD